MVINLHKALHKMPEAVPVKRRRHFHKNTAAKYQARNKYVCCKKYSEGRVKGNFLSFFVPEHRKAETENIKVNQNL